MNTKVIQFKLTEILKWLTDYKNETHCHGVVLGLSGGKDSTVVAMLAKKVWGDNVMALIMPNGYQEDLADTYHIATTLSLNCQSININYIYNEIINGVEYDNENPLTITDKAKTNIPPRIRMTVLYTVAQSLGYRVIGTGNASEAYIGWTTKWGDSACDFNPLAHLTCTEVVEIGKLLAKEFNLEEKYVTKTPSDGLCGKSDEESFGFSYAELDKYMLESSSAVDPEVSNKIVKMHFATQHKRRMPLTINDNQI